MHDLNSSLNYLLSGFAKVAFRKHSQAIFMSAEIARVSLASCKKNMGIFSAFK
jgi:hypothetical protein